MLFDNLRIRTKILFIVGASLIGMALVAAVNLFDLKSQLLESRRLKTQHVVEVATGVVDYYVAESKAGRMSTAEAQSAALGALRTIRYGGSEYIWVNDLKSVMLMHPIKPELGGKDLSALKDPNGTSIFQEFVKVVQSDKAGFVNYLWPKPGAEKPVGKLSYVKSVDSWGWVVGSGIYIDDVDAAFFRALAGQGVLIGGLVALVLGLSYWVGRHITDTTSAISNSMGRLADGDTQVAIAGAQRRDEFGEMARSVEVFRRNAIEVKALQDRQEEVRANAEIERRHTLGRLAEDLDRGVSSTAQAVSSAAAQMRNSATTMTGAADRAQSETSVVVEAVRQTSANVESVAAAAEQLNASICEISRQVSQSEQVARAAVEAARRSDGVVRGLSEAAARIGEVVGMINRIAGQTNLLALNATIEAARAGDAGKGFAVVANEVKGLANQTAKATGDITSQIASIQETSAQAVSAIQEIAQTIETMNSIAEAIACSVDQQGQATQEIARSVIEAANGARDVSNHIGVVEHAAQETGDAARELLAAADSLARDSEEMKGGLDRFLGGVRSM